MKLRTQISLMAALLSAIPVFILGGVAIFNAQRTFNASIDNSLIATIREPRLLKDLRGNDFGPIRGLADSYISIARYEQDGSLTVLLSAGNISEEGEVFPELTREQIIESSKGIITVEDDHEFRVLSFEGRRNEVYVLAASLKGAQEAISEVVSRTVLAAFAIALISGIIAWIFVSRIFKPINQIVAAAHSVALGNFAQSMPNAKSGTEFGELTNAVNKMLMSLKQFVSDASHELRTPLTVIRGYSEILQKPNLDKDQQERAVSRIETESLRMEKLVKDLLTLTKADEAKNKEFKLVDLSILIDEHFQDLKVQNPKREITNLISKSLPFYADEDSIRQLFSNIVQNIIRHTPSDSKVEISSLEKNDAIEIVIDDAGPGIAEGLRNQVFERFSRLDESRSRETGGFGLGMSIIKSIVEKHNGKIALEDSKFGGLRIRISFPKIS
ncbi:MAG: ATP-binding protein [Candidatus Nanopelagicales bacterium]